MKPREVRKVGEKMAGMRHVVLHGSDDGGEGTEIGVAWSHEPETSVTLRAVDGPKARTDTITKAEMEAELDQLEPWIKRQFERLVLA